MRSAIFSLLILTLWAGGAPGYIRSMHRYSETHRQRPMNFKCPSLFGSKRSKLSSRINALMRQVTSTRKWTRHRHYVVLAKSLLRPGFRQITIFWSFPKIFTMPTSASPSLSFKAPNYSASLLNFLQGKSSAPPSHYCLSFWIATAKDEDMESIPRRHHGQLACGLHSIWRSFRTVSDGESSSRHWQISRKS